MDAPSIRICQPLPISFQNGLICLPNQLEQESLETQQFHYDQCHGNRPMTTRQPHGRGWITDLVKEGEVVEQVSYLVQSGSSTICRNCRHLVYLLQQEPEDPTVDIEYADTNALPHIDQPGLLAQSIVSLSLANSEGQ